MLGGVLTRTLAQNGFHLPGDLNLWIIVAIGIMGAIGKILQTIAEKAKQRGPLGAPGSQKPTRVPPPVRRTTQPGSVPDVPRRPMPIRKMRQMERQRPSLRDITVLTPAATPKREPSPRTAAVVATAKPSGRETADVGARPSASVVAARAAAGLAPDRPGRETLRLLLRSRTGVQTGFVLSEILAPPVGLRRDHLIR